MPVPPVIVWLRQDLRIDDHPALLAAVATGQPVIPVYIFAPPEESEDWAPGAASRWWLHHSLTSLQQSLEKLGSRLIIRRGDSLQELTAIRKETSAGAIFWNRRYEPASIAFDQQIKTELRTSGATVQSFNGSLLYEPWEIATKSGGPYQVYTPFSKACLACHPPREPESAPVKLNTPESWPTSLGIDELQLLPRIPWDRGFYEAWQPGSAGAWRELKRFSGQIGDYAAQRDQPAIPGTSRLSPYLRFGEISPQQVWYTLCAACKESPEAPIQAWPYLRQLLWREFAYHLLYHFPQTATRPLRTEYERFPWKNNTDKLRAWQRGQTGYPIVDAGMRELWTTGWMHNRVRMITASFLVKDLLIPWQRGAEWFWDTLVDADLANNTLGWQWTAGCGADAAPYFRIFNPITQSQKFDPTGAYLRRWCPELARLSDKSLHAPWLADSAELRRAGIELGTTYPHPLVDHDEARKAALAALATLKP